MATASTTGKKRKRTVNLAKLADPQMITLTELPANRAGFKVIRSATGALENVPATEEEDMLDFQKRTRVRGTTAKKTATPTPTPQIKRADTGLLTLILPSGATEDDAAGVIEQFGLADDYTIVRDDNGIISLVRKQEEGAEVPVGSEVNLSGGMSAIVDTSMFRSDGGTDEGKTDQSGLIVARMDFNISHYETLEGVRDYLTENEIDFLENGVEQCEGGVIVKRAEIEDGVKTTKIEIAPGITAHITRGEADNIPRAIRRAVTDAAFGSFGMGHLDFSAALVDPEFSAMADNAIWQLSDVLYNIVFQSGLPLTERKDLVATAAAEFSGFMGGLMDAVGDMGFASADRKDKFGDKPNETGAEAVIPEGAVADNDASETVDTEGAARTDATSEDSGTETAAQEATARTDKDSGGATSVEKPAEEDKEEVDKGAIPPPVAAIQRQDVQDMVKVALEAAGTTFGEALKEIVRSSEETTKRLDKALSTIEKLQSKVEEIGDETVARSDEDDGGSAEVPDDGGTTEEEKSVEAVFKGAFGGRFNPHINAARS